MRKTPEDIKLLYFKLTVTASKVISMLNLLNISNQSQERVSEYLTTMIGNMKVGCLRFVTGTSVCVTPTIAVTFNNLSGLARCPIAHTCDFSLELPIAYTNYDDFYNDFRGILAETDDKFTWCIDAM